jgi:hypothetical protein
VKHADVVETGLTIAGVLVSSAAVGSALAITAALLEERPLSEIEFWGLVVRAL